jgi:ER lumen protein retaining receptor
MTLLINKSYSLWGLVWSFSLWLESVAVFPQISIIAKTNGVFTYTAHYLAALGSYRFFYVLLWIYRYIKYGRILWVSIFSGILQVLLYADFFYLYIKNVGKMVSSDLPVVSKKPSTKEKENIF